MKRPTIPTSRQQRLQRLRGTPLNVAAWVVAALLALWMMARGPSDTELVGLARALEYDVSPATSGAIETVLVDLYEVVESGQPLARLDDSDVTARLEAARATLAHSQAALDASLETDGYAEAELMENRRRFQIDDERLRLEALDHRIALESNRIELDRLALRLQRAEALMAEGVVPQADYDDLRLSRDRLTRRIEEQIKLVQETEGEQRAASARAEEFSRRFPATVAADSVIEPLRRNLRMEELRVAQIEIERRALVLRAPVSGRVGRILVARGRTVNVGEPVVTVIEEVASEVIGYLPEQLAHRLELGTTVLAWRGSAPSTATESVVVRMGPAIEQLPQRLWRDPAVPQYGLPFIVGGVAALRLTPGERLHLRPL